MGKSTAAPDGELSARHGYRRDSDHGSVDEAMVGTSPGWYYDPDDEAVYRWFDGECWTEHRSDVFISHPPFAAAPTSGK